MNREIKFRAWYEGKMLNDIADGMMIQMNSGKCGVYDEDWQPYDDIVLMQYTGLKDKNGREIYEGDLIAEINKIEELEQWGDPVTVEFGEYSGGPDSWGLDYVTTGFFCRYKDGSMNGIHNCPDNVYGYDSVGTAKDLIIYSQEKQIAQMQVDINEMDRNFQFRLSEQAKNFEDQKAISDDYRKQLRKERRKGNLAKVLIPVVAVGAFLAGSQL